jgi:hypothetical protein
MVDNIIGCAPDGALVGVALIDEHLWRKLSWLQRLCEWSAELSPHTYQTPAYIAGGGEYVKHERAMPIGFTGIGRNEVMIGTGRPKAQDGHIDGDVLARLLEGGIEGAGKRLEGMLKNVAGRQDGVGDWVRKRLDSEVQAIDEMVAVLEGVLDLWI